MTDINDLNLLPPDPIDWDTYEGAGAGAKFVLAPKGVYTLVTEGAPEKGRTREGYLKFELGNILILDEGKPWDRQQIRYTQVSTKSWPNRAGSPIGDYLLAHSYAGRPGTNDEYEQAINAVAGNPFLGRVDWRSRCKVCKYELKGYDNHPTGADGNKLSSFECPTCKANGASTRLYANLTVSAFIAPARATN